MNYDDTRHEGCIRGFYISNKAWYARPDHEVEVMFGMYMPGDGTTGEMAMRWTDLHRRGQMDTPQLHVYSDAFHALSLFGDLLTALAYFDNPKHDLTQDKFVAVLLSCGFTDMTAYVDPDAEPDENPDKALVRAALAKLTPDERSALGIV